MNHSRNAFGVSPSTGPSPDTKDPVGRSCLAGNRAARPGASCKGLQWRGEAASTESGGRPVHAFRVAHGAAGN